MVFGLPGYWRRRSGPPPPRGAYSASTRERLPERIEGETESCKDCGEELRWRVSYDRDGAG